MSGARTEPTAWGPPIAEAGAASVAGARPNRCAAASAIRASRAIAATAHGSAFPTPEDRSAAIVPAGVPHRWQNFAPGVRRARHVPHAAPCKGAPQFEQNFPVASAPQAGQAVEVGVRVGVVIGEKSSADDHAPDYCE